MTLSCRNEDLELLGQGRILPAKTVKQEWASERTLQFDPFCRADRETGGGEDLGETECDQGGNTGIWQKIGKKIKNSKNS